MANTVESFEDYPGQAVRAVAALDGHDKAQLLHHAQTLKQSNPAGWAIGEMVERVIEACAE